MDDIAAGGGDPVQEHDRRAVADRLARQPATSPLDGQGRWLTIADHGRGRQSDAWAARACSKGLLELLDVLVVEPEQCHLAVAHDPVGIDDEDRAADYACGAENAIGADRAAVRVRKQRDGEAVLRSEALVRIERLRGDPDQFRVQLVQAVGRVPVGAELPGAYRGEVPRVEREHQPAATVVAEPEGAAASPGELEIGGRSPTPILATHQPP